MRTIKKPHSPLYNNYFTNINANYNNNYIFNNIQLKGSNSKSNSTGKVNRHKSKYNSNPKHICITLDQYTQYKTNYLNSRTSHSNSSSKNNSRSNSKSSSRISTATQKNKKQKKINNNFGFNGITNIRTNLVSNRNKNNSNFGYNSKQKNSSKGSVKNNGFSNNYRANIGSTMGGISQILFGNNNNKEINSPMIYMGKSKNKNDALQGKYRLASPSIKTSYNQNNMKYGINSITPVSNNSKKKK
jgi:hypothetical protein